jgi:hypothetical protein
MVSIIRNETDVPRLAGLICMLFSYFNYGVYWDLRYVPLILAILYTGTFLY